MSDRLAISSALSVLMMAAYVLFSPDAAHVSFDAPETELASSVAGGLVLGQVSASVLEAR